MQKVLKKMVQIPLTTCARLVLWLHRPTVIAITGSVGKTTTKNYTAAMLREAGEKVQASPKSYNDTFGVPLSILGLTTGGRNPFKWLLILLRAAGRVVFFKARFVVLEVGLEFPGDITTITKWLAPDIALLTQLPATPVHRAHFKSTEKLYEEKMALLKAVKREGTALYNANDTIATEQIAKQNIQAAVRAYNKEEDTKGIQYITHGIHYSQGVPVGTDLTIAIEGKEEPFYIPDTLGEGSAKAVIAATAIVRTALPTTEVSVLRKAVASYPPTPGRMRLLPGLEGSILIDDSYNASPASVAAAVHTLQILEAKKKILLLGEMAQLGDKAEQAHTRIREMIQNMEKTTFIAVETDKYGKEYRKTRKEAQEYILAHADIDTVFLCKGSQVTRMEKIVETLLSATLQSEEVLVRQETEWKKS